MEQDTILFNQRLQVGGLFGKGFLNGTQTRFDFVPEQSTRFYFCTIGVRMGILIFYFYTCILPY